MEKKPWYKRKKFLKWAGITFLALVALGFLLDVTGYTDKAEEERQVQQAAAQAQKDAEKQLKAEIKAAEDKAKADAKSAAEKAEKDRLANRSSSEILSDVVTDVYGKDAIVSVEYNESSHEAVVVIRKEVGWSANSLRAGLLDDTVKLLKELRAIDGLDTLNLQANAPLTDKYGNTEDGLVMTTQFYSETLAKINYDNFKAANIPDIADVYWQHPALNKD